MNPTPAVFSIVATLLTSGCSSYINSPAVVGLYTHPQRLWLLAPLLIFWISRVWLLAARGQLDDDPVIFAITDRVSLLLGLLTVAVLFGSAL